MAYIRPKVAAWEQIRLAARNAARARRWKSAPCSCPIAAATAGSLSRCRRSTPPPESPSILRTTPYRWWSMASAAFFAGSLRSGIVIDSWTETVPAREQSTGHRVPLQPARRDAAAGAPPCRAAGGDRPLDWDALVGIVNDTLRRAKLRAVEPHVLDQRRRMPRSCPSAGTHLGVPAVRPQRVARPAAQSR